MLEPFLSVIRQTIPELNCEQTAAALQAEQALVIDVREIPERQQGYIPGSIHIPRSTLEIKIAQIIPDPTTPLILQCGGGTRSLLAADSLHRMGYQQVASMRGGYRAWSAAGLPLTTGESNA